jgi:hypothetical protein
MQPDPHFMHARKTQLSQVVDYQGIIVRIAYNTHYVKLTTMRSARAQVVDSAGFRPVATAARTFPTPPGGGADGGSALA